MAIQQVDLVGNSGRPVVTPQATEQLADAFRKGFVTADDIMERVSERTKAKQELELLTTQQGIADATNPGLIQAKRNQQLAAGAQAGSALALNPLAEQAKTAELKAAIFDAQAKPGGFDLMQTALSKAGFPVSVDPNAGLTDANKNEIIKRFSALQTYTLKRADAEDRVKNTETKFFPTEQKLPDGSTTKGQLQKLFRNGQEITSDEFKNWATEAEALKRTPFSQWYSLQATQPGQVVAPIAPAAPLIQPISQPASTAPVIQPIQAAPAPTIQPSTPQLGQVSPGLGFVTSVEAAPVNAATAKRTDALQRELVQLQSIDASINQARQLAVPGIVGPGQIGVTRGMHQLLAAIGSDKAAQTYTSQDQLNTVIANEIAEYVRDWKGAISDKELKFFQAARPRVDSTPERWASYLDEWQTKNEKLKKIVAGELAPDEPAVWAANPKSSAGVTSATTPQALTSPVASLPATPSAAPVVQSLEDRNRLPTGTLYKLPDGTWRRKS